MRCFQRTRETWQRALCSSASISIPLAMYTKRQEFRTYAIECFDLNMFSDREKLLCGWYHLLREPTPKKKEGKCRLLQRGREREREGGRSPSNIITRSILHTLPGYCLNFARLILSYSQRCKIYRKMFLFFVREAFKLPRYLNLPFSYLFVTFRSILRSTMIVF